MLFFAHRMELGFYPFKNRARFFGKDELVAVGVQEFAGSVQDGDLVPEALSPRRGNGNCEQYGRL